MAWTMATETRVTSPATGFRSIGLRKPVLLAWRLAVARHLRVGAPALRLAPLALLTACASTPEAPADRRLREAQLAMALAKLAPGAPTEEPRLWARVAVERSAQLRQTYRIDFNHNLHNVLVYWGLKNRGFCYHWQTDLGSALADMPHPSFEVKRIWAHPGSLWHEHHALVVVPAGGDWQDGLVLDAWRNEGVLWFGKAQGDEYPWIEE